MLNRAYPFCMFFAGVITTLIIMFFVRNSPDGDGTQLRDTTTPYTFIAPLLACDVGAVDESSSLTELKSTFATITNAALTDHDAEDVSVYFRQLYTGEWTAVNMETNYSPASLMKVPVLMAYLKQAETATDLLTQTITVTEDPAPNTEQDIAPSNSVEVGETYTIEALLQLIAAQSDNRALNVLMQYVDIGILDEILDDLGVPIPNLQENYRISPRLYSRFFRILYNATYLNNAMSDKALQILAGADYADGLKAGVPQETAVAHKFGEAAATLTDGSTGHELHDCGIVYTDEPYTICIMTKGKNVDDLAALIADLNRSAYTFPHARSRR